MSLIYFPLPHSQKFLVNITKQYIIIILTVCFTGFIQFKGWLYRGTIIFKHDNSKHYIVHDNIVQQFAWLHGRREGLGMSEVCTERGNMNDKVWNKEIKKIVSYLLHGENDCQNEVYEFINHARKFKLDCWDNFFFKSISLYTRSL